MNSCVERVTNGKLPFMIVKSEQGKKINMHINLVEMSFSFEFDFSL